MSNKSGKAVTFYFEDCGICFWQVSINGARYTAIMNAVHESPCEFSNSITLQPGKSVRKTIYVWLSDLSKEKGLKTLRIRYSGSRGWHVDSGVADTEAMTNPHSHWTTSDLPRGTQSFTLSEH